METATEIAMKYDNEMEVLKAKFLYDLFGAAVKETPNGFTINAKILLAKLADVVI